MAFSYFYSIVTSSYRSTEPLTVMQILCAALHLPTKNTKLFFPLLVLSILSSSSLTLYFTYNISPTIHDLISKLEVLFKAHKPSPPHVIKDIVKDLKCVASYASFIAPISFIVSLLLSLSIIYTLAAAYRSENSSFKTLILKVSRRWYKTMVTYLYLVLFGIGYFAVSSFVVGTTVLFSGNSAKNLITVSTGSSIVSFVVLLFMYLATRGSMSFVITVVEKTWGIGALSWSVELFIGNKQRGTLLTLILMSVRVAIYGALGMVIFDEDLDLGDHDDEKIILLGAAAVALFEVYSLSAYTVFYFECRKSHGVDVVMDVEEHQGFIYASLPAANTTAIAAAAKVDAMCI